MGAKVTPFLMFEGRAEEAMGLYLSLFPDGEVLRCERYGEGGPGKAGTIYQAVFRLAGQEIRCIDSPVAHGFTFTPSMSLFVDLDEEADLERLFATLSEGGQVMMPLNDYGFSRRFGWVSDRFGVSWQLNLP